MSYEVKTRVFEGPLDLLLQLITSHQVDITELSLSSLVSEYVEFVEAMRELDLEVTSEFLLIAATLIQLKAQHLLPGDSTIEIDDELALAEERDRLLSRLLACLTFKDVAAVLAHRIAGSMRYVPRLAGLDPDIVPAQPELRIGVDAIALASIAERVLTAVPEELDLDHLDLELPSVGDAIGDIRRRLRRDAIEEFDVLVAHCERPVEVIAYFLALLELARWGVVTIDQKDGSAPIMIEHDLEARLEQETEWR